MVGFAGEPSRPAHNLDSAKLAKVLRYGALARNRRVVQIKLHVAWNEQVKPSVVIVISPCRRSGPTAKRYPCLLCHVGERAVPIIVVETILAVIRDINVRPAVVVIVTDGHTESPALVRNASLFGNVSERTIVIVVKEHCLRLWLLTLHRCNGRAIQ